MTVLLIVSQLLGLVAFGALIWLVVRAARQHALWAVAVFLLSPIAAIVFAVRHWQAAKHPFLLYVTSGLTGLALAVHVFLAWGGAEVVRTASQVNSGIHGENLSEDQALAFMRANLDFIQNSGVNAEEQAKLDNMRRFLDGAESGMTQGEQRQMASEMLDQIDPASLDEAGRREVERLRRDISAPPAGGADAQTAVTPAPEPRRSPAPRPVKLRWEYVTVDPREAKAYVGFSVKIVGANGHERTGTLVAASDQTLRVEQRMYGGKVEFELAPHSVRSLKVRKQVS